MKLKRAFFGLITGIGLLASSQVQSAVFVKYDGVDGESKDQNHDKWIDVLSVDWGVIRDEDAASGELRAPKPKPFRITKEIDKATPLLMEALVTPGTAPRNLVVEYTRDTSAGRVVYLKYELKNVLISSYQVSGSGQAEGVPTEDFSLNFEEIKVTYTPLDEAGQRVGEDVASTWNRTPEPQ